MMITQKKQNLKDLDNAIASFENVKISHVKKC